MRQALLLAALGLAACAEGTGRVNVLSQAPSFRARALAIADVRGARGRGLEIARALAARLQAGGTRAAALEESDTVLAGSALGLDVARDPRVLAEIRRATGADAVVFLSLDPDWRSLDVTALDLATGDPVLRASARPAGASFATPDEAASAAAEALAALATAPAKAADAATSTTDEIPMP